MDICPHKETAKTITRSENIVLCGLDSRKLWNLSFLAAHYELPHLCFKKGLVLLAPMYIASILPENEGTWRSLLIVFVFFFVAELFHVVTELYWSKKIETVLSGSLLQQGTCKWTWTPERALQAQVICWYEYKAPGIAYVVCTLSLWMHRHL